MMGVRLRRCFALAAIVALLGVSAARADYTDDFDAYALGNINGQGPWVDFGGSLTSDVSNAIANSGSQSLALSLNPADAAGYGSDVYVIDLDGAPVTSGQWVFSYQQYVPDNFTGRGFMYVSQGSMPATFQEGLFMRADNNGGAAQFGTTSGPQTPLVFEQWTEVKAVIDLDADTVDLWYDGTLVQSGAWDVAATGTPGIGGINAWATDGTTGTIYIDDVSLTQVPEPATLTMLAGVGLCGLFVLRRRRR